PALHLEGRRARVQLRQAQGQAAALGGRRPGAPRVLAAAVAGHARRRGARPGGRGAAGQDPPTLSGSTPSVGLGSILVVLALDEQVGLAALVAGLADLPGFVGAHVEAGIEDVDLLAAGASLLDQLGLPLGAATLVPDLALLVGLRQPVALADLVAHLRRDRGAAVGRVQVRGAAEPVVLRLGIVRIAADLLGRG